MAVIPQSYPTADTVQPLIIPRSQHPISRKNISRNALKIMYRLQEHGFLVYLVGGAVRDLLLNRQPADFDLVTDAKPQQIKKLFRNSRVIGRRFRLVHIFFNDRETGKQQIFEVATFRREPCLAEENKPLLAAPRPTISNNTYGSPTEDVLRRDFTINALFYTIDGFKVIDYLGGLQDLRTGIIRIIGDPYQRLLEDPIRVLRAAEFACRLDFTIEEKTLAAMAHCAPQLALVPPSRMREELRGLYTKGITAITMQKARETGILTHWLPANVTRNIDLTMELIKAVENYFPQHTEDSLLETMVITAMIVPALFNDCPLNRVNSLTKVQEKIEENLKPLINGLQLPRFQRQRVTNLIIGIFRLTNGDKRVKRLRKRRDFLLSCFFFAQLWPLFPEKLAKIADFWAHHSRRWPAAKEFFGLKIADFFVSGKNRSQA